MTRIAIILGAIVLLLAGAFYVGINWDSKTDAEKKAATLDRTSNADTSKGDANADRVWVPNFVEWLSDFNANR